MFEAVPLSTPARNYSIPSELHITPKDKSVKRKKAKEKHETPVEEKKVIESPVPVISITPVVPTIEVKNYEEEFSKMYENLNIGNHNVQAKRKDLGKFPFNVRSTIEQLELVKDIEDENGEVYSGFLYLIY